MLFFEFSGKRCKAEISQALYTDIEGREMTNRSDGELVRRALRGDTAAFEDLMLFAADTRDRQTWLRKSGCSHMVAFIGRIVQYISYHVSYYVC